MKRGGSIRTRLAANLLIKEAQQQNQITRSATGVYFLSASLSTQALKV
jgi:hypothetical protein